MGTAVGGVSRAESRTESEIAAPVIEVCTNFIGRGKPLPYGSSHVVCLSSESCQGSLLRELSPQATEGVKFIKVKGRSRCGGILFTTSSAAPAELNFLVFTQCVKALRGNDRCFLHTFIPRRGTFPNLERLTGSFLPSIRVKKAKRSCF